MRKPDLKLRTRVRIYSPGTKYVDAGGRVHTYIKWASDTKEKKESKILIAIYYVWFRLLRWRI